MRNKMIAGTAILGLVLVTAQAWSSPPTVQEVMDTRVDPSADALWGSVGWVETRQGEVFRQPKTAQQWQVLRVHAETLIVGAVLLGKARQVGSNGHSALADTDTPGIRNAVQIQRDIAADPAKFAAAARRLEDAGRAAAAAVNAKSGTRLVEAGAQIDGACEACHAAYWYPRSAPLRLPGSAEYARFPARSAPNPPHAQFSAN
jgi:hypothetical protein